MEKHYRESKWMASNLLANKSIKDLMIGIKQTCKKCNEERLKKSFIIKSFGKAFLILCFIFIGFLLQLPPPAPNSFAVGCWFPLFLADCAKCFPPAVQKPFSGQAKAALSADFARLALAEPWWLPELNAMARMELKRAIRPNPCEHPGWMRRGWLVRCCSKGWKSGIS